MMDRQGSVVGRLRRRKNEWPIDDEWYIPYKSPGLGTASNPGTRGIGASPAPASTQRHNLLSVFSFTSSNDQDNEFNPDYRFPPPPSRALPPPPTISRDFVLRGSSIHKSPSYNSLLVHDPDLAGIPSSTSVPTGLSASKILFSPLNRQTRQPLPPSPDVRQRTASAPRPSRSYFVSASSSNLVDPKPHKWAAPTICDRFVYPRPSITPHVITPPDSPAVETSFQRAVRDGEKREKERADWEDFIRRRGRSMSFGETARNRSKDFGRLSDVSQANAAVTGPRDPSLGTSWTLPRNLLTMQPSVHARTAAGL